MSLRRKKQVRYLAFTLVPVLLAMLTALVPAMLASGEEAQALSTSERETVAGALDSYIDSQFVADDDGEAGFLLKGGPYNAANPADSLKGRLDSNNDGTVLGEGDDAANAPILIDVFSYATFIPGTAHRFSNTNAADLANANLVANEVTQHRNAGFSTDIISYCATGHTESPPVAGYGAMAQAGYFGSPAPKSLGLKWGRLGWGGSLYSPNYNGAGNYNVSPAAAPTGLTLPSNSACTGSTPTSELVRCTAASALAGIQNVTNIVDTDQPVDIRSILTGGTVKTSGGTTAIQNTLANLFDANGGSYDNLKKLDSSKSIIFVNRTQHTAAIAATGAKMLGYTNAKYYKWGLPMWNKNNPPGWQEQFSLERGYDFGFTSADIDKAAPSISGVSHGAPTGDSAIITWTTNEPATSKVEYRPAGGSWTTVNDTVLHASHSVTINGLNQFTDYEYKVSSYDGMANGTVDSVRSFKTADETNPVATYTNPSGDVFVDNPTVTGTASDAEPGSGIASASLTLNGGSATGCTISDGDVECTTSGLSVGTYNAVITVTDNAGLSDTAEGSFTVIDSAAPTIVYNGPTGTINTANTTVFGSYSDSSPSSGIDTASASVSIDGGATVPCTAAGGSISCDVTGLTDGPHSVVISMKDDAGNTGSNSPAGAFTVNTQAPTVTPDAIGAQPGNWTSDTTPTLSATISDVPEGQHIQGGGITIDGTPCDGTVTPSDTSISCTPVEPLSDGEHTVVYSAFYTEGNNGVGPDQIINIDNTEPQISNLQPSGEIHTATPVLSASFSDSMPEVTTTSAGGPSSYGSRAAGSGINVESAKIYLDGNETPLPNCERSETGISCPAQVTVGEHTYMVVVEDKMGNSDGAAESFVLNQLSYYFPWYDNASPGMEGDWLLIHNESEPSVATMAEGDGPSSDAQVEIYIGDDPTPKTTLSIPAGSHEQWSSPVPLTDGPVRVLSKNGQPLTVSQRVHYNGSFNEVWAVNETDLGEKFVFPWYDFQSAGMNGDWLVINNIDDNNSDAAQVQIKINGEVMSDPDNPENESFEIPAGGRVTPIFSGVMGGPVEVSCLDCEDGQRLLVSQRVHYHNAFSEMMGMDPNKAGDQAMFSWYDNNAAWGMNGNWLLVVNLGEEDTTVDIQVGDSSFGEPLNVPAGEVIFWLSPITRVGGPVVVKSTDGAPILVSQRVHYKNSFEEIPGTNPDSLLSGAVFNWYDSQSPGMTDWILVGNLGDGQTDNTISIGGANYMNADGTPNFPVAPANHVTPLFSGIMGGPVQVGCADCKPGDKQIISQRVHYNDSFNELIGLPRDYSAPVID